MQYPTLCCQLSHWSWNNVTLLITPTFFFVDYRMWSNYTTLISHNLLATNNFNVYPTFVYQLFHWILGAYACYYWVIWSKWNNWPLHGMTIVIIAWKIWFDSLRFFFYKIWRHQPGFHGHNIGSIVDCELLNQVHQFMKVLTLVLCCLKHINMLQIIIKFL